MWFQKLFLTLRFLISDNIVGFSVPVTLYEPIKPGKEHFKNRLLYNE